MNTIISTINGKKYELQDNSAFNSGDELRKYIGQKYISIIQNYDDVKNIIVKLNGKIVMKWRYKKIKQIKDKKDRKSKTIRADRSTSIKDKKGGSIQTVNVIVGAKSKSKSKSKSIEVPKVSQSQILKEAVKEAVKQAVKEHVVKEPVVKEPVAQIPIASEPIQIEPIESAPIESEPIESAPIESEPIQIEQIESEPIESTPIESEPIQIEQIESEPIKMRTSEFGNFGYKPEPQTKSIFTGKTTFGEMTFDPKPFGGIVEEWDQLQPITQEPIPAVVEMLISNEDEDALNIPPVAPKEYTSKQDSQFAKMNNLLSSGSSISAVSRDVLIRYMEENLPDIYDDIKDAKLKNSDIVELIKASTGETINYMNLLEEKIKNKTSLKQIPQNTLENYLRLKDPSNYETLEDKQYTVNELVQRIEQFTKKTAPKEKKPTKKIK